MSCQKYNKTIGNMLMEIENQTDQSISQKLDVCRKLYQEAEKQKDTYVLGKACFYLGDCCFDAGKAEESFSYLSKAISYLKDYEDWDILSRSYNLVGLLLQYQGNFVYAMEHFTEGIRVAIEHGITGRAVSLCQNFSALCESVKAYEQALQYRQMGQVLLHDCPQEDNWEEKMVAIRAMLLRLYMKMGQVKNAAIEKQALENDLEKYPQCRENFEVLVVLLEYAEKTQNRSREEALKEATLQAFFDCNSMILHFDECMMLVHYLMRKGEYKELETVLARIETVVGRGIYTDLYLQTVQCRIELYENQARTEELIEACRIYFRLSCTQRREREKAYCFVLKMYSELQQAEVNNIFLTYKANTDELTGISNRRKLNEEADRLFEKAYAENKSLGMEMLDIDFFKKYNDEYGHQIGDICIKKLADELKKIAGNNIFCARYGGDEFVVIYYDMQDEEIMKNCIHLQRQTQSIAKELGVGQLSISQGIVNKIPSKENRIWDFNAVADEALYWVKSHGRNSIKLVHSRAELNKDENIDL